MKEKWIILMVLAGLAFNSMAATIAWGSDDLGAGYTSGWLVALYEDVSQNGWSSTTINVANGSTGTDDAYLGITSVLSAGKAGTAWGSSFSAPGGSLTFNDRLYSVVFDASTLAAATHYKVTTMTDGIYAGGGNAWYQLPATDSDGTYKTTTVSSNWQAVPEPATFMLFGIGGIGAWLIRRKKMDKIED